MKVAVVFLFVAVGVCSAAFIGSPVQRTRPMSKATPLTTADRDGASITGALLQNVFQKARTLISEIQAYLSTAPGLPQNLSGMVRAQIETAIFGLQQAVEVTSGEIKAIAQNLIAQFQSLLAAIDNGSFVQRTQPMLTKATHRAEVAVNTLTSADKDGASITAALIQNVFQKARALISRVQAHLSTAAGQAQVFSGMLRAQIETAVFGLQQAVEVTSGEIKATAQRLIAQLEALLAAIDNKSLVQRTQPMLTKATYGAKVAVSTLTSADKDGASITEALIQNFFQKARALISQVQAQLSTAAGQAQGLSGMVKAQIETAVFGLQQAVEVTSGENKATAQNLIAQFQALLAESESSDVAEAHQLIVQRHF